MNLTDIGDALIVNSGGFKKRKFNPTKFEPENMFKKLNKLELSYTTMTAFKECKLKFCAKKFMEMGFFKTGEALFLGNMVHKFVEELIAKYTAIGLDFNKYNQIAKSTFEEFHKIFSRGSHGSEELFVEEVFKFIMGRKKFEPDIFFDDISFISNICASQDNYVDNKKVFLQNAAVLLRELFSVSEKIGANKFSVEEWIRFPICTDKIVPVTFLGKIDMFFPFIKNGEKYICIVDFKTGKKEYFSWDQLNYYGIFFGEEQYSKIERYFFDIKEKARYSNNTPMDYNDVYSKIKETGAGIADLYADFYDIRDTLINKYQTKMKNILKKATVDIIHTVPTDLVLSAMDIVNKELFKAKKVKNYHSTGGFVCTFCDVLSYCPVQS